MTTVGKVLSSAALTRQFDAYWKQVIGDRIDYMPTERNAKGKRLPAKFKVIKELPTKDEYLRLKQERYTAKIPDLVSDAMSEVESLQDEMQSWYDNLSEGLQMTEKAERIQEAADQLDNIRGMGIEVPDDFSEVAVVYWPSLNANSRADRASEAASMLHSAAEAAREFTEAEESNDLDTDWIDEVESAAEELEAVEFPGMYG